MLPKSIEMCVRVSGYRGGQVDAAADSAMVVMVAGDGCLCMTVRNGPPYLSLTPPTDGQTDGGASLLSVVSSTGMAALTGRDSSVVSESGCWWRMVAEGY